jgi:MerR family transcriptional regulator/heat shock protein HspR
MSTISSTSAAFADMMPDVDEPVYIISVAAGLSGLHAQTLRQYDRLGLVSPARTSGRNRLYSIRDVFRLRQVQELSDDGVNLAGITQILRLQNEVDMLRSRIDDITHGQNSTALVVWRPNRQRRS